MPTPGSSSTPGVYRKGHLSTNRSCLAVEIPRACHCKSPPRFGMHTQCYSIRLWEVAPACVRRIQYPLDCGRCEEVIWGQPQVIPDCGGFSRTLTTVAHSELVCTTSQVRMRPRSGIATQSPCILARLTLHPSGSLRGRPGPGAPY